MVRARARLDAALTEAQPADVVELYAVTRATVRRLQHELGLDERVRRQLRLLPPRRLPMRPSYPDDLPTTCLRPAGPRRRPRSCHGSPMSRPDDGPVSRDVLLHRLRLGSRVGVGR
jgi:hypothetical protein